MVACVDTVGEIHGAFIVEGKEGVIVLKLVENQLLFLFWFYFKESEASASSATGWKNRETPVV